MNLPELLSKITPLPWKWRWEDKSTVALYGPRESEDHVLWSGVCPACQESGNRCTAPSDDDMVYIEHATSNFPELVHAARAHIEEMDRLYKMPQSVKRGELIAESISRLEQQLVRVTTINQK